MSKLNLYQEAQYQPTEKVMMISPDKIKKNSYIDLNVDEKTLKVSVEFVQDIIIKESLGCDLFSTLAKLIKSGSVEGQWQVLLEEYIHPIFYYGVVAEMIIPLSYKNRNLGTYKITDDKAESSNLSDIKYLINYYKNKRDYYTSKLQDYLICNKCFAQFECPCVKRNHNYNVPINISL